MTINNIELVLICIISSAAPVRRCEVLRAWVRGAGDQPVVQEQERGDAGRAAVQQVQVQGVRGGQEGAQGVDAPAPTDDAPRRPAAAAIIDRAAPGRTHTPDTLTSRILSFDPPQIPRIKSHTSHNVVPRIPACTFQQASSITARARLVLFLLTFIEPQGAHIVSISQS